MVIQLLTGATGAIGFGILFHTNKELSAAGRNWRRIWLVCICYIQRCWIGDFFQFIAGRAFC